MVDVINLFREKFMRLYQEAATDRVAKIPGFDTYYLGGIISDAAAVAGMELIRRIIGLAGVKDVASIADQTARARAEKLLLVIGKTFIMQRASIRTGDDFKQIVDDVIADSKIVS